MSEDKPIVTTKGLDEIGVTLQLAYPGKSWQELLLRNNGNRHIVAAVVLYEFNEQDGKKAFARDVIWDLAISAEIDAAKRKELLARHPVIPPGSKWLVGVGVDRTRLFQGLPSYEKSRSLVSQEVWTLGQLQSVHISLDGAILEDGQVVGPQRENTRQWVNKMAEIYNGEGQ